MTSVTTQRLAPSPRLAGLTSVAAQPSTPAAPVAQGPALPIGKPKVLHRHLKLTNARAAQSMAYDGKVRYVLQVSHGAKADHHGDLTLTRMNASGHITGVMHLKGFGHGVALGVEPGGTLWTETGPVTHVQDGSARGTRLARFKFVNHETLTAHGHGVRASGVHSPSHPTLLATPGPRCTASVDGATLGMRWWDGKRYVFATFDLAAAKRGVLQRLTPPRPLGAKGVCQGWCLRDGRAYVLLGAPGQSATVAVLDLHTGKTAVHHTGARESGHTEPEGIAVNDGRLEIGVSTGKVGARRYTIFGL